VQDVQGQKPRCSLAFVRARVMLMRESRGMRGQLMVISDWSSWVGSSVYQKAKKAQYMYFGFLLTILRFLNFVWLAQSGIYLFQTAFAKESGTT
jgi:hypothetical protein